MEITMVKVQKDTERFCNTCGKYDILNEQPELTFFKLTIATTTGMYATALFFCSACAVELEQAVNNRKR